MNERIALAFGKGLAAVAKRAPAATAEAIGVFVGDLEQRLAEEDQRVACERAHHREIANMEALAKLEEAKRA